MTKIKGSPAITLAIILSLLFSVVAGPLAAPRAKAGSESKTTNNDAATKSEAPALARFTRDLTTLARNGKLEPVNNHDAEISQTIQILSNSQQNNPVLVGESGADAAAVADGLAQRIASGDVPENLRQTRLYSLNLDALLAGVKTSAELESRLKAVLAEVTSIDKNAILFVDEFHQFVGTRAAQTISETLAGATARGELRLMGATSRNAYQDYIASDATLDVLFQEVSLEGNINSEDVSSREEQNKGDYDFVGDKVSADLRELMQNAGSKEERARVILQTDDTKNAELRKLLRQNGVKIMGELPNLGALDVEVPVGMVEQIAAHDKAKHLSLDRDMAFLGHIDTTTGAFAARDPDSSAICSAFSRIPLSTAQASPSPFSIRAFTPNITRSSVKTAKNVSTLMWISPAPA